MDSGSLYNKYLEENETLKKENETLKEEYFSYQNHPDLKVSLLVQMTTCIPFFFKQIKYNNIF